MQALQLDHRAENDQRLALQAANEAEDSDMGDTIRLDLEDFEKSYIEEALSGFIEEAHRYRRKVTAIRMSETMLKRLEMLSSPSGGSFAGVPVVIADTGFEGTIEVILGPLH